MLTTFWYKPNSAMHDLSFATTCNSVHGFATLRLTLLSALLAYPVFFGFPEVRDYVSCTGAPYDVISISMPDIF